MKRGTVSQGVSCPRTKLCPWKGLEPELQNCRTRSTFKCTNHQSDHSVSTLHLLFIDDCHNIIHFSILPGILWTVIAIISKSILLQLACCSLDFCPSWSTSCLLVYKVSLFLCVSCDVSLLYVKLLMETSVCCMSCFNSFSLHALPFWKSLVMASVMLDDSTP